MAEHFKLFLTLVNLYIGISVIVYIYRKYRIFREKYLLFLFAHTFLYNFLLLYLFIAKYYLVNLKGKVLNLRTDKIGLLLDTIPTILLVVFSYFCIKIVFILARRKIPLLIKIMFFASGILIFFTIVPIIFFRQDIQILKIVDTVRERATDFAMLFEFLILIYFYLKPPRTLPQGDRKLLRSFACLYLSRYMIVLLVLVTPGILYSIRLTVTILFNLIPYLWYRYFAEKVLIALPLDNLSDDKISRILAERKISKREAEIVMLLLKGKSNRQICSELFISIHTVKNHIYSIYQKLNIKKRYELIRYFSQASDQFGRSSKKQ